MPFLNTNQNSDREMNEKCIGLSFLWQISLFFINCLIQQTEWQCIELCILIFSNKEIRKYVEKISHKVIQAYRVMYVILNSLEFVGEMLLILPINCD